MGCGGSTHKSKPVLVPEEDIPTDLQLVNLRDDSKGQNSSKASNEDVGEQSPDRPAEPPQFFTLPLSTETVMRGDMSKMYPSEAKVVRIFTSSTFTDTRNERNWLMERVYPKLKTFCQNRGYDFQVVDMRWGIRDEAQDDHMTTDICLNEVQLCKELSTGPFFVSFMSHKYGYRDFPRRIPATEFEKLISGVTCESAKEMLNKWFLLDDNSVPPTYMLQSISTLLPDTKSEVTELSKEAWGSWWTQHSTMHSALAQSAQVTLEPSERRSYIESVSEAEVRTAVEGLTSDTRERLVWFRRIVTDIERVDAQAEYNILRRYKDLSNDDEKDKESKDLLDKLEEETLTNNIPSENVYNYEVNWQTKEGISPDSNPSHKEYLSKLCNDFETRLVSLCENAFNQKTKVRSQEPFFQEVLQHLTFCQNKCESFHGREGSLQEIEKYLRGPVRHPFTIYGPSGCGKTSLVAKAAKRCYKVHGGKSINIIRFIGTTSASTTLPALLSSILQQLMQAAKTIKKGGLDIANLNAKEMAEEMIMMLEYVAQRCPVVLFLDSLDQLEPSHDARRLRWLPLVLPANVKVIVSTLPEAQYEVFPVLMANFKDTPGCMLEVPELKGSDITNILNQWLAAAGRKLTPKQRSLVLNAFQNCPLPLFLRLSFDEACKWKSFAKPELCILQPTVRDCINKHFGEMERFHGKTFVSRSLSYLTASKSGLSEAELDDILSCDNQVLDDVYRFWTPPIRRLPPLLVIRMKRDLGHYVVNRGADGRQVFYWYHRQFIEAAKERYCNDQESLKEFHDGLAHFFAGTWSTGNLKPFLDKKGKEMIAERHAASQPLKLGEQYNIRKLGNQAFHRTRSHNLALLKTECLLNLDFLTAKISCLGVRSVLDDFHEARITFPDDLALEEVGKALQLSQRALAHDVRLLHTQLLGRIRSARARRLPELADLLARCEDSGGPYLEPDRPMMKATGGILLHSIDVHADRISHMVVNIAGTVAVTCGNQGLVTIFDLLAGKILKTISDVGTEPKRVQLANSDRSLILSLEEGIQAYDLLTGTKMWSVDIEEQFEFVLGGPNFSRVLVIGIPHLIFLDALTGTPVGVESLPPDIVIRNPVVITGCEKYMVIASMWSKPVVVFDAINLKLSHFTEGLTRYMDDRENKQSDLVDNLLISHDGNILYVVNAAMYELLQVDIATLQVIKSYPGNDKEFRDVKLHLSQDSHYIYFCHSGCVSALELATGRRATILNKQGAIHNEDVSTPDMKTFVTYSNDSSVHIFDLNKSENQPAIEFKDYKDYERSQFSLVLKNPGIEQLMPLDSTGRYFLAIRDEITPKRLATLSVFDTALLKYIYQGNWINFIRERELIDIKQAGSWKVSFKMKERYRILDIRTMTISCKVQDEEPLASDHCLMVNGGKELAIQTEGYMDVKIVDIETGEKLYILKSGKDRRLKNSLTNTTGTKIVADCDLGHILVFDVIRRQLEVEITPQMVNETHKLIVEPAAITSDGRFLFFTIDNDHEFYTKRKGKFVTSIFVFDISIKTPTRVLCDEEFYSKGDMDLDPKSVVSIWGLHILDNTRLVSNHDDFVVRVWDFTTGTLLHRLTDHKSYVLVSFCPGSSLLVTYSKKAEDFTIRLWDIQTWNCVAIYRCDYKIKDLQLLGPNSSSLIGRLKDDVQPIIFKLKGPGSEKYQTISVEQSQSSPGVSLEGTIELNLSDSLVELPCRSYPDSDDDEYDYDFEDDDDTTDDDY
ncbi:hypothetical protein RRG08_008927 [Elysia crispata]|uniref:AAA+ ATPase domain-containing protein n=1 Tax=Elysia crispata TaxID=231223 RepID=A0AAE0ZY23_9GAST|nr:hypothetical protein RRG08_008927 [Elysia crispata]